MSDKTLVPKADLAESKAIVAERKPPASTLFLLALAALALYFCYLIARPFLNPIFLAVMIAIVFHPAHVWLQQRIHRKNLAALTSAILVLVAVVVPTVVLGMRVTKEVRGLYQLLSEKSAEQGGWNPYAMHFVDRLTRWAGQYVDLSTLDLRGALLRWLEQISHFLLSWGTHFLSNIVSFFVEAIIAFFTLFFLFREGESLKLQLAAFLPLRADQFERLFTGVSNSIVANVYGCLAVGASQGILMSLGFWVLGLPSPILWGLVTAVCSLLPIVGSFVVWGPTTMFLVISGHWGKGLILLFWSAAVVAQIDHLLRTWVISQRANMHPLLMFFALLGGVTAFGALGLFIGPVVVSVTLVALKMLRETNLDAPAA
ncbi:MAG TPA: AI-2E family transporter [Terriglobales bacterium]|nr:AI-2E family transporter [Terriglobales bacterium]